MLRPDWLAAAAVPYIVGFCAGERWGTYIMQDPAAFRQQMSANAYKRVAMTQRLAAVKSEIADRYLPAFDFPAQSSVGHSGPVRLKVVPLLFYIAGLALVIGVPGLRKQSGVPRLLLLTAVHVLYLIFFEGIKFLIT